MYCLPLEKVREPTQSVVGLPRQGGKLHPSVEDNKSHQNWQQSFHTVMVAKSGIKLKLVGDEVIARALRSAKWVSRCI